MRILNSLFLMISIRLLQCIFQQALLGKMLLLAPKLAKEQGCEDGFRVVINTGRVGGQEVFHLHIHVIGGRERLTPMIHSS